jgi:hypothetical protein
MSTTAGADSRGIQDASDTEASAGSALPKDWRNFTKGPWFKQGVWVLSDEEVICMAQYAEKGLDRGEANARLIAAAPDLLHALDCILWRHMEDEFIPTEFWDMAKDAIKKARG